ncbi:hypothetical protein [Hymenobacter volaticus]|uniref:Uncharacterized protein n=1 Tax=Hymenobacter volaticus TaxID=2932254 RepID=A0ABY4GAF4_9BACT|nr:hypothetical protein [Hymenobacter volaticus]UOQ67747.1 hypothetical protein MUN86_07755 [Hymenobacter volaticus]
MATSSFPKTNASSIHDSNLDASDLAQPASDAPSQEESEAGPITMNGGVLHNPPFDSVEQANISAEPTDE